MPTKKQEMQSLIRAYRESSGNREVDMHEVARFAAEKGWPLPKPKSALDRLAEQFSEAAREETRRDGITGRPYRVNHAFTERQGQQQMTFWVDIDEAPRPIAHKSFYQRREQMVGDAVQLSFDVEHWNRVNEAEEPIAMEMDFTEDVEWRKNAPEDGQNAA